MHKCNINDIQSSLMLINFKKRKENHTHTVGCQKVLGTTNKQMILLLY